MNKNMELFNYMLHPGFIFASREPAIISTVLGSCVSVALYDKHAKIGGMNHYKLPTPAHNETTAIYGIPAIYQLVKIMMNHKSKIENLSAQIFGGGYNPEYLDKDIGAMNIEIAHKTLNKFKIPVSSADVGGQLGRKIVFNTFTGEALISKVHKLRSSDWLGTI